MTRYDYEELIQAVKENENPETLMNLFEWFQNYGDEFWNGVCYFCAGALGKNLYLNYEEDERGGIEITGVELK